MIMKKRTVTGNNTTTNTWKNQVLDTKTPSNKVEISDISHRTHMGDSMRGLFYIVKGHYTKGGASFLNTVSSSVSYIGGYDPQDPNTTEWYMVRDYETHNCVYCGGSIERAVDSIYTIIKRFKGSAKKYFKFVSDTTTDDIYEVRYLGHRPLTQEQRTKKSEGRCPRVSPVDKCLYDCVYQEYGFFYRDLIEEVEDRAYEELREEKPINKTKKRLAKGGAKLKMTLEKKVVPQVVNGIATPKKIKVIKRVLV